MKIVKKLTVGGKNGSRNGNRPPLLLDVPVGDLLTLRRNPQYLSEAQQSALEDSIRRDGFLAPIVIRPHLKGKFEILSGNHRFLAAKKIGYKTIPCVLVKATDAQAQRIAVNLNTVHGDPTAELLAPFLAELDDDVLGSIYLSKDLLGDIITFDELLAKRLSDMEPPESMNSGSHTEIPDCVCDKCGRRHVSVH